MRCPKCEGTTVNKEDGNHSVYLRKESIGDTSDICDECETWKCAGCSTTFYVPAPVPPDPIPLTWRELLLHLQTISDEELDWDVQIFDERADAVDEEETQMSPNLIMIANDGSLHIR